MILYHEIDSSNIVSVLEKGLIIDTDGQGSKVQQDDDKANRLLESRRPDSIRQLGISRVANNYAYVPVGDYIIDIIDGELITLDQLITRSQQSVLELRVNPEKCYVSDLDLFDQLKSAITHQSPSVDDLVEHYWSSIIRLSQYDRQAIRRAEALITYDIHPSDIINLAD